jgi:hypothetical protein
MMALQQSGRVFAAIALILAVLGAACTMKAPSQTRFMKEGGDLEVSAEELRIKVRALALPFSGIIEEASDRLILASPDSDTRIRALRFKANAIPAVQSALFKQDPLAALHDIWALVIQIRDFVSDEVAVDIPPEQRAIALEAVDRMEKDVEALARSITTPDNFEDARELVHRWAAANPIEESLVSRRATDAELAAFTAEANPGLTKTIGTLSTGLGDVWSRLDVYSAFLPKQARWQAELAVTELMAGADPATVLADLHRITDAIDRISLTVEQAPGLVASEREEVLRTLQEERIIALETLHQEITTAYEFISQERINLIERSLRQERVAILEALTAERIAILEAISQERIAAMEELDRVAGGLAENAMRRVVDHLFLRLAQLLAVLLVIAVIAGVVVYRLWSRRTRAESAT